MGSCQIAALLMISHGCVLGACQKEDATFSPTEPSPIERSTRATTTELARNEGHLPLVVEPRAPEGDIPSSAASPKEREWGHADLDPMNDGVVAPPDSVPACHERLEAAGMKFRPARLPLTQVVREIPTCGCEDAVTVTHTPRGMRIMPPAVLSCQMALALVGLEGVIQEFAAQHLGESVRTLHQGGTYSCRKMERFDLVSEHSYGNAIDVFAFTLESGAKVSVLADFGRPGAPQESLSSKAKFLRALSSAAYDRDIMSVSLSPYWDALHRDHFHFDRARYRVDGSRPH